MYVCTLALYSASLFQRISAILAHVLAQGHTLKSRKQSLSQDKRRQTNAVLARVKSGSN